MGFIRERFGRITIESRSESFRIHPSYGYTEDGNQHSDDLGTFGEQWRSIPHPEFLLADLNDLIAALTDYEADVAAAVGEPAPPPAVIPFPLVKAVCGCKGQWSGTEWRVAVVPAYGCDHLVGDHLDGAPPSPAPAESGEEE